LTADFGGSSYYDLFAMPVTAAGTARGGGPGGSPHQDPVSRRRIRGEEAKRDQGAGKVQQAGEDVGAALVAGSEAAMAGEPGDRAFDRPAVASEALG
jgi:hypothetical protein